MKNIIAIAALFVCVNSIAQDNRSLFIGDEAPAISYSKWLKGTPVTSYNDDRIYVLEFWATWCGPCIAAMPHLSELSEKYKEKATFIGVNVWEKTGEEPYETVLPNVIRFVNSSAKRMKYDVITDNNAQDMGNKWLKAAGITGIPTTFVVKKGKIVWIGHPIKLDSIMDPILAGTFDVVKNKSEYEEKYASSQKQLSGMREGIEAVKKATDEKDFNKAFQLIDEYITKVPILKILLKFEKFKILLNNFSEAEALKYAEELIKESGSTATSIALAITEKDGLNKSTYSFAANTFKTTLAKQPFSSVYDKMALCYSKAGDMKLAIATQEQAIAAAKEELKDPKYEGRVFDYTIAELEETLKKYKKEGM
ncbi:MAG TPA: TlpA disulfide reductase family protein [Lacibacter sp.]|nr:TlpA disulfide reductase family protein [Lacibacter sp.]